MEPKITELKMNIIFQTSILCSMLSFQGVGDEILPSYMGIISCQPLKGSLSMECHKGVDHCSNKECWNDVYLPNAEKLHKFGSKNLTPWR